MSEPTEDAYEVAKNAWMSRAYDGRFLASSLVRPIVDAVWPIAEAAGFKRAEEELVLATDMVQVAWMGPYGVVPGGMDVEPAEHWQPVYIERHTRSAVPVGEGDDGQV